jgi:hypothetical protein
VREDRGEIVAICVVGVYSDGGDDFAGCMREEGAREREREREREWDSMRTTTA